MTVTHHALERAMERELIPSGVRPRKRKDYILKYFQKYTAKKLSYRNGNYVKIITDKYTGIMRNGRLVTVYRNEITV
jgi:hypothetical protein